MSRKNKSRKARKLQEQQNRQSAPDSLTKVSAFKWDIHKEEAAQLLAENDFSHEEIGAKVGVTRVTLHNWRQHPEFAARIAEIEKKLGDISLRRVIARRNRRVLALEQRWLGMQKILEERAANSAVAQAPGGKTGLIIRQQKMIGSGENAMLIEEFVFDAGLDKAMRETEKQAAIECGQWTEKIDHKGEFTVSLEKIVAGQKKALAYEQDRKRQLEKTEDNESDAQS